MFCSVCESNKLKVSGSIPLWTTDPFFFQPSHSPSATRLHPTLLQERTVPPGRPGVCWNLKKKNSAVLVIANCTQAEEESMVVDKHKRKKKEHGP